MRSVQEKVFDATVILFVAFCLTGSTAIAADCKGIWSARGHQPHVGDSFTADAVVSPNKENTLTISEDAVVFTGVSSKQVKLDVPVNAALMEIVWSQDSNSFAINESDATNEGPWQTYIYRISDDAPQLVSIDAEIKKAVAGLPRCDANAPANIAAIAWTDDSKQAIVAAETPTLDICKTKKGSFVGFRMSVDSGKLIERLTRTSLQEKWADVLGCRLRKN